MAALTRGLELLESAVGYAFASIVMVTSRSLTRPTPCAAWDVGSLLDHVSDSVDVLHQALNSDRAYARTAPEASDPLLRLRGGLLALLATIAAAGPADRAVAIWDRELTSSMVAVTGAIEIAVHGWDIAVACGGNRPIPPRLCAVLLAAAPVLVPADARPGLFADPIPLPRMASPSDRLVAFLGRVPPRGDSEASPWSA